MISTRNVVIALAVVLGVVVAFHLIQKYRGTAAVAAQGEMQSSGGNTAGIEQCRATSEACLNDPECLCYCSVKCGPRKKEFGHADETKNDKPVVVDGVCFCKQWDADNYASRNCAAKDATPAA